MSYRQPITDEQLAPFLEAAKSMTIPENTVPPLVAEVVPAPSASQNKTILAMHQALIAEAIKTNTRNAKEYKERKELKAEEAAAKRKAEEAAAKRKAEEAVAKRKAEEAAAKKAVEEENACAMDANLEGEDEVTSDSGFGIRGGDRGSEGEEEEGKGKGKGSRHRGCSGVPVRKMCEGYKVPANTWYQRPCMGDVQMDANDQIFYVRSKDHCFVCHMQSNVCSFTQDDEADFIMPEAADNKELQAKLKKLCDEQDTFRTQKEKVKVKRNKLLGNSTKAGTKKKVQVNVKASGSTPKGSKQKVVSEEDDIEVTSRPKRARTVTNSNGSNERILSVAESLHYINKALIETVNILRDTRATSEKQAKYLCGIKTCMVNLQNAMQTHICQDEEFADEEVVPVELEDMEKEVKEVCEEVEEVHEEDKEVCEEVEEVHKEVEGPCEEVKEGREVEDDGTMKDPEADEL
ncbi:hypothetical protein M422DRAFT_248197 [Sphaerobolus stellatus SS14]|uniref:Uncharacterized protein n=1 Tax=Sphaerobolus stellatus (strain SS14) TaxID=990650 RepID=A0A0C9UWK6_SPHS4|nr:hypothetical protein M422DRAFT_248197 [Sphaerobolus stellatus SS14]